jgi:hypothetical protein
MLSQIKMTEHLSATNVESDGDFESLLASLEDEVQAAASLQTTEVLMLLIDKWENDIIRMREQGVLNMEHLLNHYVRLKISLHHIKKAYDRGWYPSGDPNGGKLKSRVDSLQEKAKEARRNYYVAKRGIETEHRNGCACRGCRCLGQVGA